MESKREREREIKGEGEGGRGREGGREDRRREEWRKRERERGRGGRERFCNTEIGIAGNIMHAERGRERELSGVGGNGYQITKCLDK